MQRRKVAKTLILFVTFSLINSPLSHSQARKPAVRIKVDRENSNLYAIINGRQYFIDRLQAIAVGIPEPLVDPSRSYVFYASNTGCGFEQEGMTVFVSDVYGKTKRPILGRCWYLRPVGFLSFQGKNYLLITQTSESPERSFWLYDISRREFVLHADGEIREIRKGIFSYGYYEGDTDFKQIGKVTMSNLIKREYPLRLLPRYPTHGITQKRDVRVYPSVIECDIDRDKQYKTISKPGTRVLIVTECEDGGHEIYYDGFRGKVMKGNVRPMKFGSTK